MAFNKDIFFNKQFFFVFVFLKNIFYGEDFNITLIRDALQKFLKTGQTFFG